MTRWKNLSIKAATGLAAILFAVAATGAHAQAPATDNDSKIQRCRENATDLIWLDREKLRERCGLWTSSFTGKRGKIETERLVYSRYFVVTLHNGVVASVRQRRQIFTGFKKDR